MARPRAGAGALVAKCLVLRERPFSRPRRGPCDRPHNREYPISRLRDASRGPCGSKGRDHADGEATGGGGGVRGDGGGGVGGGGGGGEGEVDTGGRRRGVRVRSS